MTDLKDLAQSAVETLLQSDEDQLYEELGMRVQAMKRDLAVSASFAPDVTYDAEAMGPLDDLRDFGRIFFNRLNTQAWHLACGTDAEDTEERKELMEAFGVGKEAVAATLAAVLVAQLGLVPAVAAVVAALIIKLFFRNVYGAMCDIWKKKLPEAGS